MSDNEHNVRILRGMAWERAQGELRSMLHTFWSGGDDELRRQYNQLDAEIQNFRRRIESDGLHE